MKPVIANVCDIHHPSVTGMPNILLQFLQDAFLVGISEPLHKKYLEFREHEKVSQFTDSCFREWAK